MDTQAVAQNQITTHSVINPTRGFLLVEMGEVKSKTVSGIILPTSRETRTAICKVITLGKDVTLVKVGDLIHIQNGDFKLVGDKYSPEGKEYAIVKEDHVIGVYT